MNNWREKPISAQADCCSFVTVLLLKYTTSPSRSVRFGNSQEHLATRSPLRSGDLSSRSDQELWCLGPKLAIPTPDSGRLILIRLTPAAISFARRHLH